MNKYLVISLFLLNFAKGIVGFGHLMTREHLIPPFPFLKMDKNIKERIRIMNVLTTEKFKERAHSIHGHKYDYSKVVYKDGTTNVIIICKQHGEFQQRPKSHLKGHGCPICGGSQKLTTEEFIRRSSIVHKGKFDYSQTTYINNQTKVKIICPIHGAFEQVPSSHMDGHDCPYCADRAKLTKDEFVHRAKLKHGDKYDYSLVEYNGATTKVKIICSSCGAIFWQIPNSHLLGRGCPTCSIKEQHQKLSLPIDEWIIRSRKTHSIQYDYSKVHFSKLFDKVEIGCPKHGVFLQEAKSHMEGQNCPRCTKYSWGEELVAQKLEELNIKYIRQFRIANDNLFCHNEFIIVDFYLPKYNCVIEYNGGQHYKPISLWGGERRFEQQQARDNALRQYCKENKIKLIEIHYREKQGITDIIKTELKIK